MASKRKAEGDVDDSAIPADELEKRSRLNVGPHNGDWSCPVCNHHNYKFRLTCQKCNKDRPHPGKHPGDWNCPQCDHHNYVSRAFCQKCNTPRGFIPNLATSKQTGGKHPGDWICQQCFDLNYSSRTNCRKCRAPKAIVAIPSGKSGRLGDWYCPGCNDHNYASRSSCRKCNALKTESAVQAFQSGGGLLSGGGGNGGGSGNGGALLGNQLSLQSLGLSGLNSLGGLGASVGPIGPQQRLLSQLGVPLQLQQQLGLQGLQLGGSPNQSFAKKPHPGDWLCPCGNHNYASRMNCKKCNTEKTAQFVEDFQKRALSAPNTMFINPEDWSCPNCMDHNFASRSSCRKCGVPKPPFEG